MAEPQVFIPQQLDELTGEWLGAELGDSQLAGGPITNVSLEVLGDGAGFVGILARLFVEFESGARQTLIAKLPTPIPQNRAMGEMLGAYEREILFYQELAAHVPVRMPATYYSFLDRDRGSEKQEQILGFVDRMPLWMIRRSMPLARWIAKRKKRRYLLLMEDLGAAAPGDQVAGAGPERCERALRTIAAAHAALWESPLLEGRFYLTRQDLQCRMRHIMYQESRPIFSERFANLMPRGLDRLASWLDTHGTAVAQRMHGDAPQTLIHGDFRLDNLFFGGPEGDDAVAVIDWQLAGRGCAAYDVAYFLGGGLHADVSRADEQALLRSYHDELTRHGVKGYDYERFERDYERGLLTVLQTIASTDAVEMGDDRGVKLIDLWVERLLARANPVDLDALV